MPKSRGNIANLRKIPKGVSGNPKGRPKKLPGLDKLLAEVLGNETKGGVSAAQRILEALRARASRGDVRAAEVLLERAYGKVKQTSEVTGKDGAPLIPARVEVVLVDATPDP
jgi:hypothetical protein